MIVLDIALIIIICSIFALITYKKGMLDISGATTAFTVGLILGTMGGVLWIILLLIFLASAFLATRYKFNYKESRGIQEGKKGERGVINVLANGLVPVVIALFSVPSSGDNLLGLGFIPHDIAIFLFVTAIACAASDTLASEMGVLSDRVYLITSFERVEPGTNGGISLKGQFWAFAGSAYTFFIAFLLFHVLSDISLPSSWPVIGIAMGFISCQIDSILGATAERKGLIGKSSVNFTAISLSVLITGLILWLIA